MRTRSQSARCHVVQEIDVLTAPMAKDHKHLVLKHFRRLRKILDEDDEDAIGRYTSRQATREQLARMTLVFRDYTAKHARGEIGDECESMVADVIDASFYVAGREHTFSQPAFTNPLELGREHELAALMQEMKAGNVDDVTELWNVHPTETVLPESSTIDSIAQEIDWTSVICRSASEDNLLYRRGKNVVIKDRPKWERSLSSRSIKDLDRVWPLTPAEMVVGRERSKTDPSDWF